MKIAIFPGYGGNYISEEIREIVDKSGKSYRVALAEEIEKLPYTNGKLDQRIYDEFMKYKSRSYLKAKDGMIIFKDPEDKYGILASRVEIVDVDITKPWRISRHDGGEFIEYFNGITIIDENTNESDW